MHKHSDTFLSHCTGYEFPFRHSLIGTSALLQYINSCISLGSSSVRILLVIVMFPLQYHSLLSSPFLPFSNSTLSGLSSVSFCVEACFAQPYPCLASELRSFITLHLHLWNKGHSCIRCGAYELKPNVPTPLPSLSLPLQCEAFQVTQ